MVGQIHQVLILLDHEPLRARRHRAFLRVQFLLQLIDEVLQTVLLLLSLRLLIPGAGVALIVEDVERGTALVHLGLVPRAGHVKIVQG